MPDLPTIHRLDGNDVTLPEVSDNPFWLSNSTWQFPDFENADTFVNRLVRDGLLASDPVVDAVLDDQSPALSVRSLQYRFLRATGLSYKVFSKSNVPDAPDPSGARHAHPRYRLRNGLFRSGPSDQLAKALHWRNPCPDHPPEPV